MAGVRFSDTLTFEGVNFPDTAHHCTLQPMHPARQPAATGVAQGVRWGRRLPTCGVRSAYRRPRNRGNNGETRSREIGWVPSGIVWYRSTIQTRTGSRNTLGPIALPHGLLSGPQIKPCLTPARHSKHRVPSRNAGRVRTRKSPGFKSPSRERAREDPGLCPTVGQNCRNVK